MVISGVKEMSIKLHLPGMRIGNLFDGLRIFLAQFHASRGVPTPFMNEYFLQTF